MSSVPPEPPAPWSRPPSNGELADGYLTRARAFLAARSPDAAIREASRALELFPGGPIGYVALDVIGDSLWMKGSWGQAFAVGERMLEIDSQHAAGYLQVGRALLRARNWKLFDETMTRGVALHPDHPGFMQMIGVRWRLVGNPKTGEDWIRRALQQAPGNVHLLCDLALVLSEQERATEARAVIDEMLAIDPTASQPFCVAALQAFRANRFKDALVLAALTLERDPENDACRVILARARWFASPWFRPFWAAQKLSPGGAIGALVTSVLVLMPLHRVGLSAPLLGLAVGYMSLAVLAVAVVEHLNPDGASALKPNVDLPNY